MINPNNEDQCGSNAPVLLVDDSPAMRTSIGRALESNGLWVVVAANGFEALAQVVRYQPCLVLADVTMPRLDGYQLCALVKRNIDFRAIPVVLLTGADGRYDAARARLVGSDARLPKPVSAQILVDVVKHFVKPVSEAESV